MAGDQSDLVAERLAASNSKLSVTASGDIRAVDAVAPQQVTSPPGPPDRLGNRLATLPAAHDVPDD
jgi:hypothetical protein